MKKKLVLGGLFMMLVVLFAGCASTLSSLGNEKSVGDETTVLYQDGTVKWAYLLDIKARVAAREKASYQTTNQVEVVVWKPAGYDFEYDRAELTKGIQSGNYRIGKAVTNGYWVDGYVTAESKVIEPKKTRVKDAKGNTIATIEEGEYGIEYGPIESHGGYWQKLHEDRPEKYNEVEVKTIENRSVSSIEVDQEKYQTAYDAAKKEMMDYIIEKMDRPFRDLTDDDVFNFVYGGKIKGKKIKSVFEKQLQTLPAGTVLINGGLNKDLVMMAEVVDGVLKCQVSE
jgi:hypothetical protein